MAREPEAERERHGVESIAFFGQTILSRPLSV